MNKIYIPWEIGHGPKRFKNPLVGFKKPSQRHPLDLALAYYLGDRSMEREWVLKARREHKERIKRLVA
jgi:hypothetical protein